MMKRLKTSKNFLMAALILCTACATGLLITGRTVAAIGAHVKSQEETKAGDQQSAGKPLKGIELKLIKDGKTVATTTSDENGEFRFSVVPKGEYTVALALPKEPGQESAPASKAGGGGFAPPTSAEGTVCYVTLNLPGGKKMEKGYDFSRSMAFDPPSLDQSDPSAARRGNQFVPFTYESDGTTPCDGAINTSRSNIKVT